jgi:hypothetical protein
MASRIAGLAIGLGAAVLAAGACVTATAGLHR